MGAKNSEISEKILQFIEAQKLFFVATAAADGRVNISPKGMDSLRVMGRNRVIWLNVTGSGNETAAHVQENPRMTLMFAAFEGDPLILRLYGQARVIHMKDPEWQELYDWFDPLPGVRQIFDLSIDLVQESCGMAVPFYDYVTERDQLTEWAVDKGSEGIRQYWQDKNQLSLDGKPTNIIKYNT
jgi:general stress protein 26